MITTLRQRLIKLHAWPEAGDALLELLPVSRRHSADLTKSDYDWLPKVVDDALKGSDIGARYPSFFQKLVTSNELCEEFLDALEQNGASGT